MDSPVFFILVLVNIFVAMPLALFFATKRKDLASGYACGAPFLLGVGAILGFRQASEAAGWHMPVFGLVIFTIAALSLPFIVSSAKA